MSGRIIDADTLLLAKATATIETLTEELRRVRELAAAERESATNAERRATETQRDYDELSARYETTVAKFGRAVAALREAKVAIPIGGIPPTSVAVAAIDTILADADSAAAGEAWRELEAVVAATIKAKQCYCALPVCPALAELDAALAAVDARRGGGR